MIAFRSNPRVWISLIASRLAGQTFCDYAPWFMANHEDYERQPSTFDLSTWRAKHAELVRQTADWQRGDGSAVLVEAQNKFSSRGKSGTVIGGQPDLVRLKAQAGLVTDCKTGRPQDAHIAQVLTYMLLLPFVKPEYHRLPFAGRVQYDGHAVDIPPDAVDDQFKARFRQIMAIISSQQPPLPTPSSWECKYCPLTHADCAARIDEDDDGHTGEEVTFF